MAISKVISANSLVVSRPPAVLIAKTPILRSTNLFTTRFRWITETGVSPPRTVIRNFARPSLIRDNIIGHTCGIYGFGIGQCRRTIKGILQGSGMCFSDGPFILNSVLHVPSFAWPILTCSLLTGGINNVNWT